MVGCMLGPLLMRIEHTFSKNVYVRRQQPAIWGALRDIIAFKALVKTS
jgi:hypothetical protein